MLLNSKKLKMIDSKIQVKVGIVEFSGEGNQDWLAQQLDKILEKVPELLKIEVASTVNSHFDDSQSYSKNGNGNGVAVSNLSILNIAGKISAKTGSDLAIVAAAYLHFVLGKTTFSRDDISTNMKSATGIFKQTFIKNLTSTLSRLEKGGYFLKAGSNYSLNANKVTELYAILSK